MEKQYLTAREASAYISMAMPTLYQYVSSRKIPHSKIGGRLIFIKSELDAFISSKKRVLVEEV